MNAPLVSPRLEYFSAAHQQAAPRHLGSRYDAQGAFLPEPGNTVVCHLVDGSRTQEAIVKARSHLMTMPEAADLAFTPISSLHMTVFQGIIEHRRDWPYWPKEMPHDASIDAMTAFFRERLKDFPKLPAFSMQITDVLPTGLIMKGASEADDKTVALWRDAFAEAFGYRHPDHDIYVFHITFAYVIRWLDPQCLPRWQAMLNECLEELQAALPVVEMRPPAFCAFQDMKHFEELLVFDPA